MYGPPLVDGSYSNPPAPTTYTAVSALSLPPHRTLSSASSSLHAAPAASSPSYYAPSLYSFPTSGYLPSASSTSSLASYPPLPSSSPGLSLFSSPSSSPHSSHLSGRCTPPSVSNLQAVLDAAELSEQRDSQLADDSPVSTSSASRADKRARRADEQDVSTKRRRQRNNQPLHTTSNDTPSHSEEGASSPSLPHPWPPPSSPPLSLTELVDRQSLSAAFAVPSSIFPSASLHRQWHRQRKQSFKHYLGAPLNDSDAVLVSVLRRAARLFASLGGGRAASGEAVELYRVERELLLALFASELPLPLVSSLFDVSGSSVKRLLEHTGGGDELESYISQAKQKRLSLSSSSSQSAAAASTCRPRNLICKRTGRPMRDEKAFAQSFFQRPQLASADISSVWLEYVKETTVAAAGSGGAGSDGTEARRPPLSRAHFFTLAPEERRRKRKELTESSSHSHSTSGVKSITEQQQAVQDGKESREVTAESTAAASVAHPPRTKRAKVQLPSDGATHKPRAPAVEKRKVGRPKRAAQKSSLTEEMKALLPMLLAPKQTAPSLISPCS